MMHLTVNFANWTFVATIVAALTSLITSAPTGSVTSAEPWNTPCGGAASEGSGGGFSLAAFLPTSTLSEVVHEAAISVSKSERLALTLRDKYFHVRLSDNLDMAQYLNNQILTGFPQPSQVFVWRGTNDTASVVKNDYHLLSVVAVFMQQVQDDELLSAGTLATDVHNYVQTLLHVLCKLTSIMESLSLTLDSHVGRDVMPATLRQITVQSKRAERDYIIAQNSATLLADMIGNYVAMDTAYKNAA